MMNFTGKSKAHRVAAMVAALASPLILAQVASLPAQAADYDVGSMHISQPWALHAEGRVVRRRILTITNKGATADRVSCVSSDAAGAMPY